MKKPKRELILKLQHAANDNLFPRPMRYSHPMEDTLGGRIKIAREACHFSVAQLARRINVLSKTLRRWEKDCCEPHADNLQMLADKLDVPLMWLLGGDDTFAKSLMSQLGQNRT